LYGAILFAPGGGNTDRADMIAVFL